MLAGWKVNTPVASLYDKLPPPSAVPVVTEKSSRLKPAPTSAGVNVKVPSEYERLPPPDAAEVEIEI